MQKTGPKILIIDDEEDVRKSIKLYLSTGGYKNVDSAQDAKDGIEKALAIPYDLIILDMIMPEKSGWDVLKQISKKKIKTRMLVLSAVGLPNVVRDEIAVRYSGVEFLPKTNATTELLPLVEKMLKSPAAPL